MTISKRMASYCQFKITHKNYPFAPLILGRICELMAATASLQHYPLPISPFRAWGSVEFTPFR